VEICTVGSVRGENIGAAMANLNGHEAGNGGHSQATPTAHRFSSTRRDVRYPRLGSLAARVASIPKAMARSSSAVEWTVPLGAGVFS